MHISEEEFSRQFLEFLISNKRYPKGLVIREHSLSSSEGSVQRKNRRVDILVSYKNEGTLSPLLLIECKRASPNRAAYNQLFGYNKKIGAIWCGLVWPMSYALFHRGSLVRSGTLSDFPDYCDLYGDVASCKTLYP